MANTNIVAAIKRKQKTRLQRSVNCVNDYKLQDVSELVSGRQTVKMMVEFLIFWHLSGNPKSILHYFHYWFNFMFNSQVNNQLGCITLFWWAKNVLLSSKHSGQGLLKRRLTIQSELIQHFTSSCSVHRHSRNINKQAEGFLWITHPVILESNFTEYIMSKFVFF